MGSTSFIDELKRRNVIRMAGLYLVGAWLVVQVAGTMLPMFGAPDWVARSIVTVLAVGFVPAMIFSWVFELTPDGIKRDADVLPQESIAPQTARSMDRAIIVVLTLALGYFGFDKFVLAPRRDAAMVASLRRPDAPAMHTATNAIPDQSIAVLPLVNESGDKDQLYFSDGLSENLIVALSQFSGLKVIGRNSSFQFRDTKDDSKTIGTKLGVATLLEGSVQRAGDAVRISAELIRAVDGKTLWSQKYDRPYKDLFALQDEITQSVTGALKARLLTVAGAVAQSDRPPSGNLDAYNAYLRGKDGLERNNLVDLPKAIDFFNTAINLDPHYARAYAALAEADTFLGNGSINSQQAQQAYAAARAAINKALALDPDIAATHFVRGLLLLFADLDWNGTQAEFQRAVQLAPNDQQVKGPLGQMQAVFGHPERAIEPMRQTLASDSLNTAWYHLLAEDLLAVGRFDEAEQTMRKSIELQPDDCAEAQLATIEIARGNATAALDTAKHIAPGKCHDFAQANALQLGNDSIAADAALKSLLDKYANTSAFEIAQTYALRKQPDQMFAWLDRAFANRDSGISVLHYGPFIPRYKNDPRFAAFCEKVGLPTPAEVAADASMMPAGSATDASTTAPASGRTP
jgi:TolB-like protein/Tfp pilus assembly protein PilF